MNGKSVAQTAEPILPRRPTEPEGWKTVILNQRRNQGNGDPWQAQVVCHVSSKIHFVDEQNFYVGCAHSFGPVAQHHPRRIPHSLECESKGRKSIQLGQVLVQLLKSAARIVFRAKPTKLNARSAHMRLGVFDSEDHYLMAPQLQGACQSGHWIEMTGSRETKSAKSCHGSLQSIDFKRT